MNPTGRFAVVFWKNLSNDNVSVMTFTDEQDMIHFAEDKRLSGFTTLIGEVVHVNRDGVNTFKLRKYGAYPYLKYWFKFFSLFLISLIIFLILYWK
jgi:hypothetical protein